MAATGRYREARSVLGAWRSGAAAGPEKSHPDRKRERRVFNQVSCARRIGPRVDSETRQGSQRRNRRVAPGVGSRLPCRHQLSGAECLCRRTKQDAARCSLWTQAQRSEASRWLELGPQSICRLPAVPGTQGNDGLAKQLGSERFQ